MGGVVLKNLRQLVFPYVVVSLIICILFLLFRAHGEMIVYESLLGTTLDNDYSIPLGPVWFFLALFWCRVIYGLLALHTSISQRSIICFIGAMCLVMANRIYAVYQIPYEITQGVVGMFFYHIGVVFKDNNQALKSINRNYKALWIFVTLMILLFSVIFYKLSGQNMNLSSLNFPLLPIDMVNAGGMVVTLFFIVEYVIEKNILQRLNKFLSWFGKNSMTIYVIHCIEYHFTIPFVSYIYINNASSLGFLKYAIICGNPIVQTFICVCGLYGYGVLKNKCLALDRRSLL